MTDVWVVTWFDVVSDNTLICGVYDDPLRAEEFIEARRQSIGSAVKWYNIEKRVLGKDLMREGFVIS